MNFRHAFHHGKFADVVKHAVLVRILVHLREKPAPFRVIDTHAGAGSYDLAGEEARRSGEWRDGIDRLVRATIAARARALLAPYLDAVAACNGAGRLTAYPRSPALARAVLRAQDRLIACELEPNAAAPPPPNLARPPPAEAVWRRWRSTAEPRSTPMCRRRSGAAWCSSIPPSRTPAISRGWRKRSPPRIANGRAGSIWRGTRSRSRRRPTRWRAACAGAACPRFCARNSALPRRARRRGSAPAA